MSCKSKAKLINGVHLFYLGRELLENKCSEVRRFESNALSVAADVKELSQKFSSTELRLQSKREECRKLRAK